jgi:hypothetical protein
MMHGRIEQMKMLLSHDARIGKDPEASPFVACRTAAKHGYEDVVELCLELLPWDYNNVTLHSTASLVLTAAIAHHWDMLCRMLRRCMLTLRSRLRFVDFDSFLYEVATNGQGELVRYILDALPPSHDITWPLLGAARGGQLSTCRLFLEKGILNKNRYFGIDGAWTQAVVTGSSIEVYQLLEGQNLWISEPECYFLPVAAEHGHLDLTKLAVRDGWDADPFSEGRPSPSGLTRNDRIVPYRDDVRYFALLRAIVSGHKAIVRWLIRDVGVKISDDSELANPKLRPVELAYFADDSEMVELLLSLGAEARQGVLLEQCARCQKKTEDMIIRYQQTLYLGNHGYNQRWYRKSRSWSGDFVCSELQVREACGLFC